MNKEEFIHPNLGITDGRVEEISSLVERIANISKCASAAIITINKYLTDPIERSYAVFLYGIGYGVIHHTNLMTAHVISIEDLMTEINPFGNNIKGEA